MRKVIGFFALVGLISLPLVAGLAVSAATGTSAHHEMGQRSATAHSNPSVGGFPAASARSLKQ
jgi:UPF0716 family protein affecting phage T7 exclusion